MATNANKEANTNNATSQNYKTFLGARVLWPPDVEDDILEGAILETHNILRDKTKDGQAVRNKRYREYCFGIGGGSFEEIHG